METMVKSKVGSVIVADADNKPLGIFTQSDALRRVVIPNHAPTAPIAEVMTAPPATISSHATAYDAMLAMAMHRIRHLVIVDGEDKVVGVVSERDLFAMQRIGLRNVRKVIEGAADIDELSRAAGDVRRLCLNMLAQGVNAEKLTQFISGLNDSLTRRVIEIALGDHDFDGIDWAGWPSAPKAATSRPSAPIRTMESFSPAPRAPSSNPCGSASSPSPSRSTTAWRAAVSRCARATSWPAIRPGACRRRNGANASASGSAHRNPRRCSMRRSSSISARCTATITLARELRHWLLEQTHEAKVFLRFMAENAVKAAPPLGMIRDFTFDNNADFPHTLDLKAFGARPFVDAARIIALAHNIPHSSTVERLRAASRKSCWAATTSMR
jgi:CBS domain-containing protein